MISQSETISEKEYPGFNNYRAGYITFELGSVFMALMYFIVSFLLFQGYRTENPRLCKPWLYWNYFSLGLFVSSGLIVFLVLAFRALFLEGLLLILIMGMIFSILLYFVFVVQRFVTEITE
ncbi:uncharacterized protein LOC118434555 [Folsomia candida]|uniref:uncharacterized protein LOC118434555 n=1 Tax=Folsomia candida TaxID=158441 RepID=UPI0016055DF6|nr:uncharacterized protein LOC118434555 [Folsomia candida]